LAALPELDCFVHAVRGAAWRERDNRLIVQMKLEVCDERVQLQMVVDKS
jgi:hypothetical protein